MAPVRRRPGPRSTKRSEAPRSFSVRALGMAPVVAAPVRMEPPTNTAPPLLLAAVGMGSGAVSYGWNGTLPTPTVEGAVATYADVQPGVDLRVTATDASVDIAVILHSAPTGNTAPIFDFTIQLTGLSQSTDEYGQTTYKDASGDVVGGENNPIMWDSYRDPQSDNPHNEVASTLVSMNPASGGQQSGVRSVTMPLAFLTDPSTQYPVTLDPAPTVDRYAFAYVDQRNPNQSYVNDGWDSGRVHVGAEPGPGTINRAMYQFQSSSVNDFPNTDVYYAVLNTVEDGSWNCTPKVVNAYSTNQWVGGMNWNTQPGGVSAVLYQQNVAYGYSASCPNHNVNFVVTSAMASMASAGKSVYPFELRANDETDQTAWKKFDADATLTVYYNHYPNTPTNPVFAYPTGSCSTTFPGPAFNNAANNLTLRVTQTDPDSTNTVSDKFWIVNAHNGSDIKAVQQTSPAAQGLQDLTFNAGTFPSGDYAWRAQGYDGRDWSLNAVPVNGWCYFRIKNEAPPAPLIERNNQVLFSPTAVTADHATSEQIQFVTDPAALVACYVYTFNASFPQSVPPCGQTTGTGQNLVGAVPASNGVGTATIPFDYGISQLYVWSVDVANNISNTNAPTEVTFSLYADANPQQSGHAWLTDYDPANALADPPVHPPTAPSTANDGTATPYPAPMTLNGATWVEASPFGPSTNGNRTVWGLHLTGSQRPETTTGASGLKNFAGLSLDTTQSFATGVWVRPASAGAMTAMSQDLATNSGFTLGVDATQHPRFCVGDGHQLPSAMACVSDPNTTIAVGQWVYVIGWWDNLAGRVHVQASVGGQDLTDTYGSFSGFLPHAAGQIALGWDRSGTAAADGFNGDLAGAMFYQGVPGNDLRFAQLIDLAAPAIIPAPAVN